MKNEMVLDRNPGHEFKVKAHTNEWDMVSFPLLLVCGHTQVPILIV